MVNRKIKFRIWDNVLKGFTFQGDIKLLPPIPKDYVSDLIWQQFTGLKDKNNKEIYEGDIVIDSLKFYWKIVFENFEWVLKLIKNNKKIKIYRNIYPLNYGLSITVKGNIFENPDLIKKSY